MATFYSTIWSQWTCILHLFNLNKCFKLIKHQGSQQELDYFAAIFVPKQQQKQRSSPLSRSKPSIVMCNINNQSLINYGCKIK